ncbi:MAG: EamA family transporter [Rhodospirillaceae bacterium]|nr:MAG: EamA family transporter [Rhodospirillaceae bacterium]
MSSSRLFIICATALAPCLWGTTYIVFTETLPVDHPLLVAALRALPAGFLLLMVSPSWPTRDKLVPYFVLGLTNIGLFLALLFIAAARLPGGVVAMLIAAQPLFVAFLAIPLLRRLPHGGQVLAAFAGIVGVGFLVSGSTQNLDSLGIAAALGAAASMALGTVLIERWGRVGTPLSVAAWQLTIGGALLLPIALVVEGLPPMPTVLNAVGFVYLIGPGTALAYWLWVRGIGQIGSDVAFLGLLSPLVAAVLGMAWLGEELSLVQALGAVLILLSAAAGVILSKQKKLP